MSDRCELSAIQFLRNVRDSPRALSEVFVQLRVSDGNLGVHRAKVFASSAFGLADYTWVWSL